MNEFENNVNFLLDGRALHHTQFENRLLGLAKVKWGGGISMIT